MLGTGGDTAKPYEAPQGQAEDFRNSSRSGNHAGPDAHSSHSNVNLIPNASVKERRGVVRLEERRFAVPENMRVLLPAGDPVPGNGIVTRQR